MKPEHTADALGLTEDNPVLVSGVNQVITPDNVLNRQGEMTVYNPFTQDLTLTGIARPSIKHLQIVLNDADPKAAANAVTINQDGSFKFVAHHIPPICERYFVMTYDQTILGVTQSKTEEKVVKINLGMPVLQFDTSGPHQKWIQKTGSHHFDVYTTDLKFTVSGKISAYNTGVAINVNGENIFVGQTNWNEASRYGTSYLDFAPEHFSKEYALQKNSCTHYSVDPYQLSDTQNHGQSYDITVHQIGQ
ncbi:hypothetical protein H9L19_04110 [Weissella diestrammenae]|uniref:Uncharacterized protein n=1 Tax=Weissella diestrammenae TaxID=1162633 RepID=A0A7G9T7F7_9LACO|nr:hypothetical protein [Weissella diestrammenae]QNN76032.1 hypothetical protein H9L19_04110 [Weissella diestrammenae]